MGVKRRNGYLQMRGYKIRIYESPNLGIFCSMGMLILSLVVFAGCTLSHTSKTEGVSAAEPMIDSNYRLGAEDVMLISG
jgi:hypothetical protein